MDVYSGSALNEEVLLIFSTVEAKDERKKKVMELLDRVKAHYPICISAPDNFQAVFCPLEYDMIYRDFLIELALDHNAKDIFYEILLDYFEADDSCRCLVPWFIFLIEGLQDLSMIESQQLIQLPRQERRGRVDWIDVIDTYARIDEPILISGETGTSKGLLSKAMHKMGHRRNKEYWELNCAAIPETLIESELFGYKEGAFSVGLCGDKKGILDHVNGGTLLLDEIGSMPAYLQVKLLKVIEDKKFYPLSTKKPEECDIRFIAATQPQQIKGKKIYPDLLYRLGYPDVIETPPLRERLKHLPDYILDNALESVAIKLSGKQPPPWPTYLLDRESEEKILAKFRAKQKSPKRLTKLADDAKSKLTAYSFPGNYRELENIFRQAIIMKHLSWSSLPIRIAAKDIKLPVSDSHVQEVKQLQGSHGFQDVKLKDILHHAEIIKKSIVESKVLEIIKSGKDIKNTLIGEGLPEEKYNTYYQTLRRIVGKGIRDLDA